MRYKEICGICEKPQEEIGVWWVSPRSAVAHARCVRLIEPAENYLRDIIGILCEKKGQKCCLQAHSVCIGFIQTEIDGEPILSYLEKNGIESLTYLFQKTATLLMHAKL